MRSFFILLILFSCNLLSAQTLIQGIVLDSETNKPVEYASIELKQLPDSTVSKISATDKKGKYSFTKVKPGNYFVSVSFIGFDKLVSKSFIIEAGASKVSVETLELANTATALNEVTVTGRRSQLNASIDRKIYNVEQDIMSTSGSVSDILKNIPSVEVDIEGNVSLRGSGDILILINGRPNPLMGRTRAEVLQQLPANSIERIEVITNPSARYRPDGTSGIINIVLKKNIKNGFNSSVTVNAGNRERYNGNVVFNYRPKKFNLFSSYSIRQDTRKRIGTLEQSYYDPATNASTGFYNQVTDGAARPFAHIINGGIDFTINEENSIGASVTYYNRKQLRNEITRNLQYDDQKILVQNFVRFKNAPEYEKQKNVTF